jgi:hypothetical protein
MTYWWPGLVVASSVLLFWMSNDLLQLEGGQWKEWQYIADARLLYYGFK